MLTRRPILMYHSTSSDPDLRVNVTPQTLRQHLEVIARLGFKCNSIRDHMDSPPGTSMGLSFDDGYLNNLDILPLLKEFDAGATFFVLTGCEDETLECHQPARVPIMGAEGWAELHRNGFEVAAHGVTHRKLTSLDSGDCELEIRQSIEAIRAVTEEARIGYAYPFGAMSDSGYQIARRFSDYACCTRYRLPLGEDRWRMRRINIGQPDDSRRLQKKLSLMFRLICDLGY